MTHPPIPGTPYVVSVSSPGFHRQRSQSRFHLIFNVADGIGWQFELRSPIRYKGRKLQRLQAFPRRPSEPLDVEQITNTALCRFVDDQGIPDKDWIIATIIPDIKYEAPVPYWPPWKGLAETA